MIERRPVNAFAYVFAGSGTFRDASEPRAVLTEHTAKPEAAPVYDASNHSLVLFDRGNEITVQAGPQYAAHQAYWSIFAANVRTASGVTR
jgi:hypothetical protein